MTANALLVEHVRLMADYNRWMNTKVYETASKLSVEQLNEDRGAFFGSLLKTLNHIMVGDTLWLKRIGTALPLHEELQAIVTLETPASLDAVLFTDLSVLSVRREFMDAAIVNFSRLVTCDELVAVVNYSNIKGLPFAKNLFSVLMHFFNHQTHHRGQVTTLLSQFGLDVGVTDLVVLIPNL